MLRLVWIFLDGLNREARPSDHVEAKRLAASRNSGCSSYREPVDVSHSNAPTCSCRCSQDFPSRNGDTWELQKLFRPGRIAVHGQRRCQAAE
jgi:hypothetical protein